MSTHRLYPLFIILLLAPTSSQSHLLPPNTLLPSIRASGQTLESCESTADCGVPRQCLTTADFTPCSTPPCVCVPAFSFLPCSTSIDCELGEVCTAGLPGISFNCISDSVVEETPQLREVNAFSDPPLPGGGFTLDQCRTNLQCAGSRVCVRQDPQTVELCRPSNPACVCSPPTGLQPCQATSQCVQEEVCAQGVLDDGPVCVTPLATEALPDQIQQVDEGPDAAVDPDMEDNDAADQAPDDDPAPGDDSNAGPDNDEGTGPAPDDETAPGADSGSGPDADAGDAGTDVDDDMDSGVGPDPDPEADDEDDDNSGPNPGDADGDANPLPAPPMQDTVPQPDGLSFSICESGSDCSGLRGCFTAQSERCIDVPGAACRCAPVGGAIFCGNADHCPDGEVCVEGVLMGFELRGFCASPSVLNQAANVTELNEEDGRGVNFASCFNEGGCAGERTCVFPSSDQGEVIPCPPVGGICICFPENGTQPCFSSAECDEMELCLFGLGGEPLCALDELSQLSGVLELPPAQELPPTGPEEMPVETPGDEMLPGSVSGESPSESPETGMDTPDPSEEEASQSPDVEPSDEALAASPGVAATPAASPSPSTSPDPVICFDARLLEGMSKEELVYKEHGITRVLCDNMGSCATPGHIVVWNGVSMMMSSYCVISGGCKETRMEVNSPRWRKQLRVATRTSGLEFTAFAARYATRGEEIALTVLVRVGL